ncbi:hypothetical protein BC830DRAFT_1129111 [Chytriomyces sp. MP71]|nr:hypothetical protein BC830DRAFT_1129111 [Chytriomyces sp. MP71]
MRFKRTVIFSVTSAITANASMSDLVSSFSTACSARTIAGKAGAPAASIAMETKKNHASSIEQLNVCRMQRFERSQGAVGSRSLKLYRQTDA